MLGTLQGLFKRIVSTDSRSDSILPVIHNYHPTHFADEEVRVHRESGTWLELFSQEVVRLGLRSLDLLTRKR